MNLKLVDFLAKINQKPGFFKKPGFLKPKEQQILTNKIEFVSSKKPVLTPLKEEPFIGMRSERKDLEDSSQWVKKRKRVEINNSLIRNSETRFFQKTGFLDRFSIQYRL